MDSKKNAIKIIRTIKANGFDAVLIGGAVRDQIMGKDPKDYDIASSASPDEIEAMFDKTIPVGKEFGVIIVVVGGEEYEVATFREESDYDGRKPGSVSYSNLANDVLRRDFTINAIAMDENGKVTDLVGGVDDIEKGILRFIGDAEERIEEDKLRMLRAIRFKSRYGFKVLSEDWVAIKNHASEIGAVSQERIFSEMTKMLVGNNPRMAMSDLKEVGLLQHIIPEMEGMESMMQSPDHHPEGDVWTHTLQVLERGSAINGGDPTFMWACLLHDIGKMTTRGGDDNKITFHGHDKEGAPIAKKILRRMKAPSSIFNMVSSIVEKHMWPLFAKDMKKSTINKMVQQSDLFKYVMDVHKADALGSSGDLSAHRMATERTAEFEGQENEAKLEPIIMGRDLIAIGFNPSPEIGKTLEIINDAFWNGDITDKQEAMAMAASMLPGESA